MNTFVATLLDILTRKALDYAKNYAMKSARPRGEWRGKADEYPCDDEAVRQAGYKPGTPCRFVCSRVSHPLRFRHESGVEYLVGDGVSDGGSTPPFLRKPCAAWADLEPFGAHKYAFYLHDAMYHDGGVFARKDGDDWRWLKLNRAQADFLFLQALTATGRNAEVFAIWRAVRRGGARAWRRARQDDIAPFRISCNSAGE